jgi:hypothetical protein
LSAATYRMPELDIENDVGQGNPEPAAVDATTVAAMMAQMRQMARVIEDLQVAMVEKPKVGRALNFAASTPASSIAFHRGKVDDFASIERKEAVEVEERRVREKRAANRVRPAIFEGAKPGETDEQTALRVDEWIQYLERWLKLEAREHGGMTEMELYDTATSYLGGQGLRIVQAVEEEAYQREEETGEPCAATWQAVRDALRSYYEKPTTAFGLAMRMTKIYQKETESVSQYYERWSEIHRLLRAETSPDRDIAASQFVRGLRRGIKELVLADMTSVNYFKVHCVGKAQVTAAIAQVRQLAVSKEEYILITSAGGASRARSSNGSGAAAASGIASGAGRNAKRESSKVDLPASEVKARRDGRVCINCCRTGHRASECRSAHNPAPFKPPASAARVNVMDAEDEMAEDEFVESASQATN